MPFLPTDYKPPVRTSGGGNYFKVQDGKNKVRILSDAIVGYVYWNNQNKPVRTRNHPGNPSDIRVDATTNKPDRIKFFWAFCVWDYVAKQVAIWEVTQSTIQEQIEALLENEDWGDPKDYDITISKTGQKLETSYTLQPSPQKTLSLEVEQAWKSSSISLEAVYSGTDPFNDDEDGPPTDEDFDKIPF